MSGSKFVPICGPVVADTAYMDGVLVARDVSISLPEVVPATVDLTAMGTFTMPVWQLIQHLEAIITRIGLDKGLRSHLTPDMKPLEVRWVQTITEADGTTRNAGCKAFLKGIPANLPGINLDMGSTTEQQNKIALTRYNLFVDGVEMWLIDRLAGIVRIDGKNYADLNSML